MFVPTSKYWRERYGVLELYSADCRRDVLVSLSGFISYYISIACM